MPLGAGILDMIFAPLRNYHGVLCEKRNYRGREAADMQSETSSVGSQCRKKRRKVQVSVSLCVNSEYVERLLDWLGDDAITTIGIYGMGGIGKTTLATQLHTSILNHDHATAWVSVEMDFTVWQLQQKIAVAFGIDLQGDKNENRRAAMICSFLSTNGKCILFLDDLWGDFRREDVGIPRGCKLVLISCSLDVCRILHCQKVIKVEPLAQEKSLQLFNHNIGCGVSDSKELNSVRKLVYDECGGLPLAITVLANSWREVSECMDYFSMGSAQLDEVFSRLKLSYERLNNVKVQRCFLYSALYPKDYAISKEELIRLWIGAGIIDDVKSLQAQYDMGHTILNKLLNSCLLDTCQNESIKVHDLVRRMALSIASDKFMVENNIPSKLDFCGNLHAVSFVNSSVSPNLSGTLLKFTYLSILLLQHNLLEIIPESLFLQMTSLRVLSLSGSRIMRLPSSISSLKELRVLDASSCQRLKQVPPQLAQLHKLRFLNFTKTAVNQVPRSLEMLKQLTELVLPSNSVLKKVPKGVLLSLSNLKRLSCRILDIIFDELQNLESLEMLDAKFDNLSDLSKYVRSQHWRTLECFHLQVGHQIRPTRSYSTGVSLHGCSFTGREADQIELPSDIQELHLDNCSGFHSLSDIINPTTSGFKQEVEVFSSLEICTISRCHDVEQLLSPYWMQNLQSLEILEVEECALLKELIVENVKDDSYFGGKCAVVHLPQLKQLILTSLPELNSIYKGQLVCGSLRSLAVMNCPNLKRFPFSYMDDVEDKVPSTPEWIEGKQKWWDL